MSACAVLVRASLVHALFLGVANQISPFNTIRFITNSKLFSFQFNNGGRLHRMYQGNPFVGKLFRQ